jgi:hypothetical protein
MRGFIRWRIFLPVVLIIGAIAWGIHYWSRIPFWVCAGLVLAAWLINGRIAMVVDE